MAGKTPQQRTRDYLTERGWLVATVERRKRFPDRKKHQCAVCGNRPMIEISSDLWEIFDLVAVHPEKSCGCLFVQTTSRVHHATRRNKILASMEAKLVLLSGHLILLQSWRQSAEYSRWQAVDEWITIDQFSQAPHYPADVKGLMEIRRKDKKDFYPPGTELKYGAIKDSDLPF